MNNIIYVIFESHDDYELSYNNVIGFVNTESEAKQYCYNKNTELSNIKELSIKNYIDFYTNDWKYSELTQEFNQYIMLTYFPEYDNDCIYEDLSDEDNVKWGELVGDYDTDTFKSWCKNIKGLSDDVIEATIKYNHNDYDTIVNYYWECINKI